MDGVGGLPVEGRDAVRTPSNSVSSLWATASTAGRSTARDAPFRLWARRKTSFQSGVALPSAALIAATCSRCSISKAASSSWRMS